MFFLKVFVVKVLGPCMYAAFISVEKEFDVSSSLERHAEDLNCKKEKCF